ncbi:MAG: ribbon-helix-helix protein, CopG family [Nitrospiraceae bacterium]|nr:ribbon-helix-helix protein, CopG family [Nitrospiraceae bacterium]
MKTASKQHERITISLPPGYSREIKKLAADLDLSQSDLIVKALDEYRESKRKKKIEEIASSMVGEYRQNTDLTALTALDGEDFR